MTLIIANALLIAWLAFELVLRRRGQASTWDADVADKNTTKLVVLTYVLLVVVSVFVRRPGHVRADSATAWMFVAIAAIGLLLRGWAMQHLGQFYSRTLRVQDEQRVVDDGPFASSVTRATSGQFWCGRARARR